MNASAIQGMPAWPQLLTMMRWLSYRDRKRYGKGVTNSNDLARITSAGILLVDYLALRRDCPVRSKEVPLLVSGVYKVCLGYQLAYLPDRFSEEDTPAELKDAAGFLAYLEESGLLIGEAEVCSCPPAMILQSYEAMIQETAAVSVPQIHDISVDWERFDEFAESAGEAWQTLIMFAIRMPDLIPQLDSLELPLDVTERLNQCLMARGTQLLERRGGLVVEVANGVRSMSGRPTPPLVARTDLPREIQPYTATAVVMEWLRKEAPDEITAYESSVARELQLRLGPYEEYEAGVLRRTNEYLCRAMKALDLEAGPPLTQAALSRICGPTMHEWAVG
jgi:hypothetical protein